MHPQCRISRICVSYLGVLKHTFACFTFSRVYVRVQWLSGENSYRVHDLEPHHSGSHGKNFYENGKSSEELEPGACSHPLVVQLHGLSV